MSLSRTEKTSTVSPAHDRETPYHDDLRRLRDYWNARRHGRRCPSRTDIDPTDFPYAIGRVSMVDVLEEPDGERRFRFRLAATPICRALGRELTGKTLDELPGATRAFLASNYIEAATSGEPVFMKGEIRLDGREWRGECLVLPLSSDGVRVDRLLCARYLSLRTRDRYVPVDSGPGSGKAHHS
jgi:hypothetical protein